jgi:hypothetical protein
MDVWGQGKFLDLAVPKPHGLSLYVCVLFSLESVWCGVEAKSPSLYIASLAFVLMQFSLL